MESAFIRIVSSDIIDLLISEGFSGTVQDLHFDKHDKYGIATSIIRSPFGDVTEKYFTIITQEVFDDTNPNRTWNTPERIDCEKDIEKFKQFCLSTI